jgi:hypothetical protein
MIARICVQVSKCEGARRVWISRQRALLIRLRSISGLKLKSKFSIVFCASRNCACFSRSSNNRAARRASSSDTKREIRSMGAVDSASAWRSRDSNTAAIPPSRSCRRARSRSIGSKNNGYSSATAGIFSNRARVAHSVFQNSVTKANAGRTHPSTDTALRNSLPTACMCSGLFIQACT